MVLRKRAPPHLYSLSQGNARSEPRSPTLQISPSAKSTSSASPKRLTRPRRAQSSPQPRRLPSQESVYSPDLNTSPAFDLMSLEQAQKSPVRSSPTEPPYPWADELVERPAQDPSECNTSTQPATDNPRPDEDVGDDRGKDRVPSILVAGTQRRMAAHEWQAAHPGTSDTSDWEHLGQPASVPLQSNNPFLKPRSAERNPWEDNISRPQSDASSFSQGGASGRLGQDEGYIPMTARLSLFDMPESESPWADSRFSSAAVSSQHDHVTQHTVIPNGPTSGQYEHSNLPTVPYASEQTYSHSNPGVVQPEQSHPQPGQDSGRLAPGQGTETPATTSTAASGSSHVLIELDESSQPHQTMETSRSGSSVYDFPANEGKTVQDPVQTGPQTTAPPLPDRSSRSNPEDVAPPTPNPAISQAVAEQQREKRTETYSIRKINWMDSTGILRESPVLVQNKNGPCPLLALVNALVLRASQDTQPPILRALQTKEQISLGLLIEALFDELITRLGPDDQFPDIEALSLFLTMLHTGMNVNPRLTLESEDAVGSFLETNDIRLYGTFGVQLVHGWVAPPSSEADAALKRAAQYHEDIQLLPFRKHELEDRVFRGESLSPDEETAMKDIQAIQQFTEIDNATQLSPFGLQQLAEKLPAGSSSILFRNDHFSTLYKHPQTHQLFTLVTDAGYSNHAEVVWESLVDVNGANTGFFSGDFRPVGNISSEASDPSGPRTSSNTGHLPPAPNEPRRLSAQEQADADYAYALSLQYQEEEQRARTGGRRDSAPSQGAGVRASDPTPRVSRHSQPPRRSGRFGRDEDDAPPPTYEQAANSPPYHERRAPVAPNVPYSSPHQRAPYGRRSQGIPISTGPTERPKDRNKDCIVM
ncbi:hypothetical protein BDV59DRAFT_57113 [Aspergillus ambiguus]|uniref:uncharacterized protein n=1 Tax=Aspergillus ambiguus TaxID=176160 RepID=UPI003CCE3B8C